MKRLSVFLCGVALLLAMAGTARADLNAGLIAHYPFDGNANDASGNGNNGTVYGATLTVDRLGNANRAYSFDGVNDYIDFGNSPVFSPSTAITLSAWIKRSGNIGQWGSSDFIIGKLDDYATRAYYLAFWNDMLQGEVSEDGGITDRLNVNSIKQITDTEWHHVAAVFDGSRMDLYIDGVLNSGDSNGNVTSIHQNASRLVVGYCLAAGGHYFSGSIDDVRVYNRALSAAEIDELAGSAPPPSGWFDDFESYAAGSFPSAAWTNSGNTAVAVEAGTGVGSSQSLKTYGIVGGCWGALAHRPLAVPIQSGFVAEWYARTGAEALSGCHSEYADVQLFTGPSWTYPGRLLASFDVDDSMGARTIRGHWTTTPTEGPNLGAFTTGTWYKVKVQYERIDAATVRLSYWINDVFRGSYESPAFAHENDLAYFSIGTGEGTAWFDNVRVSTLPAPYNLTIAPTPTNGRITGPGIDCGTGGTNCTESYPGGTPVTLTAHPASSYTVNSWSGACASAGSASTCTVTMDAAKTVSVSFRSGGPGPYTLTISPTPTNGRITASGVSCGTGGTGDCTETYTSVTTVTLTATPSSGYTVSSWSGACSGTTTTCTVTMDAAKTASVSFSRGITISPVPINGRVTGPGINCGTGGTDCSEASGTTITLTAVPDPGYAVGNWSGLCGTAGTARTCTLPTGVTGTLSVTFIRVQYPLTIAPVPTNCRVTATGINCGSGGTDCTEFYASGTSVSLTMAPSSDYHCSWSGDCAACGGAGACPVTMNAAKTCSVICTPAKYTLTINPVPTNGRIIGPGINCGTGGTGDCSELYPSGPPVTLTAKGSSGYRVNTWSGACSSAGTAGTCTLTMDAAKTVSVTFRPVSTRDTVGVFRPSGGAFYLDVNGNGLWDGCATDWCVGWGGDPADKVVLGDGDNTGARKIGIYRDGMWYLDTNGNGYWDGCGTDACIAWGGMPEDIPVVGDWNNTGATKVGVYRNGTWYLDKNGNGVWDGVPTDSSITWGGRPEDIPVVGDWNNSGSTKIGIYRNGTWYLDRNGNGVLDGAAETLTWGGMPEDIPVVGDWNNTGATKIGIYRNGTWYLDRNGNGLWDAATEGPIAWGGFPDDTPVLGDWNGTGSTKIGIYRDGVWYLDTNGNGVWDAATDSAIPWGGVPGDTPVVGRW